MKRPKIYIFIPIAALITVFALVLACLPTGDRTQSDPAQIQDPDVLVTGRQPVQAEESDNDETEEVPGQDTGDREDLGLEDEEEEEAEEEEALPSVVLVIYEGPSYSPEDDICFYRIQAEVTGDPEPRVEFSKDDSMGAWGTNKTQINLTRNNPTYTLTATATNSHGIATDSLTLKWGCGGETATVNRWQEMARLSGGATSEHPQGEMLTEFFNIDTHFWRLKWSAEHTPAAEGDGFLEITINGENYLVDSVSQTIAPGERRESMLLSPGNAGMGTYNIRVKFKNASYTITVEQNLAEI